MDTIFVSSTFQDMQYERDAIQKDVFPRLNAIAHEYGQSISFCDLRWGINTENLDSDEKNYKVLDVCLEEINRSDNPMLVILGDRYGWIPPSEMVKRMASENEMDLDDYDISATALEIEYGRYTLNKNTLFYFRTIKGNSVAPYFYSEDSIHHEKMMQLKDKIEKTTGTNLKSYNIDFDNDISTEIKNFSEMLYQDLLNILLPKWKEYAGQTPLMREAGIHWQFVNEKRAQFLARKEQADEIINKIIAGQKLTVIKGESGTGKSTLFGMIAYELKKRNFHVIPIASGLTSKVTTAFDVLKYEVLTIESILNEKIKLSLGGNINDSTETWKMRLKMACKLYSERCKESMIIMIDAVDQLIPDEDRDELVFIPSDSYSNISFLFTSLLEIEKYSDISFFIKNMKQMDREAVVNGILSRHHKELAQEVVDAVVVKNGNPLYIDFLLQRLLLMNRRDFEEIKKLGGGIAAIKTRQLEIVNELPVSLEEICLKTFEEAGKMFNGDFVKKISNYLALSRYGLRDTDLALLIGNHWNYLDFAHLTYLLRENFIKREDGRYDFMHKCIRNGLASSVENKKQVHKEIYLMLCGLDVNDPIKKSELFYHGILSGEMCRVEKDLVDYIQSDKRDMLKAIAENTYFLCRNGHRDEVEALIRKVNEEDIHLGFLAFFNGYCKPLFKGNIFDSKEFVHLSYCFKEVFDSKFLPNERDRNRLYQIIELYNDTLDKCLLIHDTKSCKTFICDFYDFIEKGFQEGLCEKSDYANGIYRFVFIGKEISQEENWVDYLIAIAEKIIDEKIIDSMDDGPKGPFYGCMGELYTHKKNYKKVTEIYLMDLSLREKYAKENPSAYSLYNLSGGYANVGTAYFKTKNFLKSKEYLEKSIYIDKKITNDFSIEMKKSVNDTEYKLAVCYFACGNLYDSDYLLKAYDLLWKCIEFARGYFKYTQDCEIMEDYYFKTMRDLIIQIYKDFGVEQEDDIGIYKNLKNRIGKVLKEDSQSYLSEKTNANFMFVRKEFIDFYLAIEQLPGLSNWLNDLIYIELINPMVAEIETMGDNDYEAREAIYSSISCVLEEWGECTEYEKFLLEAIHYASCAEAELFKVGEEESKRNRELLGLFKRIIKCYCLVQQFDEAIDYANRTLGYVNIVVEKNPSRENEKMFEDLTSMAKSLDNIDKSSRKGKKTGNYVYGIDEGYGEYIFPSGEKYYGEWKQRKPDGFGVKILESGNEISGKWKEGELIQKMSKTATLFKLRKYKKWGLVR